MKLRRHFAVMAQKLKTRRFLCKREVEIKVGLVLILKVDPEAGQEIRN